MVEKEKEREGERRGGEVGKRNAEAKKIEAPERVGWTGIMAVLELHYQSSVPLAPRHYRFRPTGTTLDSIPFHSTPFPPWKLSRYRTPLLFAPGKTPPSNTALPKLPLPRKPCPHFLGAWRSIPLDVYAWYPPFQTTTFSLPPRIHLSANICIAFCIICMRSHAERNYFDEQQDSV